MDASLVNVSFEDFVALSGAAKAMGLEKMCAHYDLDLAKWTQISGGWTQTMAREMHKYASFGVLVEQEAARIQAGGAPRPVALAAPRPPPPQAASPPGFAAPQPPPGYAVPQGLPAPGQSFEQQAAHAAHAVGSAAIAGFDALGSALDSFAKSISGPSIGQRVLVQWSDGNRYPGTVVQIAQGQIYVTMSDGRQLWVPQQYVFTG